MLKRYAVTYYSADGTEIFVVKAESSKDAIEQAREARPGPTRSARWWRARHLTAPVTVVGPVTMRLRVA